MLNGGYGSRLAKGEIDHSVAYLTRWNTETKKVELIMGKFYDPETNDFVSEN
jgi:hypothetical protein